MCSDLLDVIVRNIETEFGVKLPMRQWGAFIDIFVDLCATMLDEGKMKYNCGHVDPCAYPGYEKDGRLGSFAVDDRRLRRCPKQPFIASVSPPAPLTHPVGVYVEDDEKSPGTPLEDPREAEVWGTKEAMEADLVGSMRVNNEWHAYYWNHRAASAVHYRLIRLLSRMCGISRNAAAGRLWAPFRSLGAVVPVDPEPPGDRALLAVSDTVDPEQRRHLAETVVALMRGEIDWQQIMPLLGQLDDTREPILYDVASSLATISQGIVGNLACACHKPGPFDRRRTTREIWGYLTRLIAALLSPLSLCAVTFPYPTRASLPKPARWFPFWDETWFKQCERRVPSALSVPAHEDIEHIGPDYNWTARHAPGQYSLRGSSLIVGVLELAERRRATAALRATVFPRLVMVRKDGLPVF